MDVRVKRVYDDPDPSDGARVLVDRLWPRGVSRDRARLDLWARDIGPSHALREWFGHDPKRYAEFVRRYHTELDDKAELLDELRALGGEQRRLTLLYSARDVQHNQAVALQEYLLT
jgi:uncharacterized protein YeaO (DUF488 family)